jgi:hypothetical protein
MLVPVDQTHLHAVQLNGGAAAVHGNDGVGTVGADVVGTVHREGDRVTGDDQMILSGEEVLDEVPAVALLMRVEVEEAMATRAGSRGVMTAARSAGGRAVARAARRRAMTGAACCGGLARAADQRDVTADRDFPRRMPRLLNNFQRAPGDRGMTECAADGGVALLNDGVVAGAADVNRVMAGGAMLDDRAALAEGQGIVAAADDDLALPGDVDLVVAVASEHGAAAKNGDINPSATRNTDGGGHKNSPLSPAPIPGFLSDG